MKKWDKVYWLISALLYFAMFFTSILDAGRLHETQPVPLIGILCGGLVFSLGQILVLWAKRANRFFSAVVRIQEDRGQIVCSDGPYRFVRHPGYLGGLLYTLVTPLLLGSYWGLIPAILIMIPLLVRTRLEDRTLQDELAGYADYARKVPYRLVPRIW